MKRLGKTKPDEEPFSEGGNSSAASDELSSMTP